MKASRFRPTAAVTVALFLLILPAASSHAQEVLSSQVVSQARARTGDVLPDWSHAYPALVSNQAQWRPPKPAFSDDGKCIAIAGNGEALVLSNTGRTLWTWRYGNINRFVVATSVAVSPNCDAVAIAGDSGYKYVWIAERSGHAVSLPFQSTPLGLAFDRTGQLLAVGTGAGRMFLFHRDGQQVWSTPPYSVFLPSDMDFSPDDRLLLVRNAASILRMDGSIVARFSGGDMSISRDLQTVVTSHSPPHGPGPGTVTVAEQSGKFLWNQFSGDPGGVITPAGDKIMARVNIDQNLKPDEPGVPYEPGETILKLFDRDGTQLKEFPDLDGRPVAFSPDGKIVLLETSHSLDTIDLDGKKLYSIPATPFYFVIAPDFSTVVIFSRSADGELEFFKLK